MSRCGNTGSAHMLVELWKNLGVAERRRLKIAVLAMIFGSLATALTPYFVGTFVNAVVRHDQLVALRHAWVQLLLLASVMLIVSVTAVIQHQEVHAVTTSFTAEMRNKIYSALLRWDMVRFVDDAKGAVYGRANRSVDGAEKLIKLGAADLVPAVLVTVFGTVLALAKYGFLGLVMVGVVPTGFAIVAWQIRSQRGIRVEVNQAKEGIDGEMSSFLGGLEVTRTLGAEADLDARVRRRTGQLRMKELRHHVAMSLFDMTKAINETIWLLGTLVAALNLHAVHTPGDLSAVVLLFLAITKPLRELHRVIDEGSEAALQTANLHEDLAVPHDPSYATMHFRGPTMRDVKNAIEFDNVTFTYPNAEQPTLRGITITISTGERVGLVGTSGCGKSTLLKLAARLVHNPGGDIRLNGQPIGTIDRTHLVDLIGYLGQKPLLFQGTVRENLSLGRPGITDDELVIACKRANILADIMAMPKGYDTVIGEEGARLSGGQSQRLCLARALVRTPPILLLDEPTSALDGPSQVAVQEAIDKLEDITVLVVAHRLSTLRTMSRILVLDQGRIVEEGTFDNLAARGEVFASMLAAETRAA